MCHAPPALFTTSHKVPVPCKWHGACSRAAGRQSAGWWPRAAAQSPQSAPRCAWKTWPAGSHDSHATKSSARGLRARFNCTQAGGTPALQGPPRCLTCPAANGLSAMAVWQTRGCMPHTGRDAAPGGACWKRRSRHVGKQAARRAHSPAALWRA